MTSAILRARQAGRYVPTLELLAGGRFSMGEYRLTVVSRAGVHVLVLALPRQQRHRWPSGRHLAARSLVADDMKKCQPRACAKSCRRPRGPDMTGHASKRAAEGSRSLRARRAPARRAP